MRSSKPFIKNRNKLDASKPIFVPNLVAGNSLKDVISQTGATVSISGARYGIVNGVVAQFAANVPRIEDKGFGACPAFTQLAKMTETLTDAVWVIESGATGVSRPGGNRLIYTGGSTKTKLLNQAVVIPGGTASKILILVARVSAATYPQKFRVNNTHLGVIDNFSSDITINEPTSLYLRVQNSALVGSGNQQIGIAISTDNQPFDINIGMNLAEANFIYPYVPNNTTSSVSVVSEAATSSTGTSFDLDLSTLSRLKNGLRGPNAQGHIELEFESNMDSGWLPNDSFINILSFNNNAYYTGALALRKTPGGIVCWYFNDSVTNNAYIVTSVSPGQTIKFILDYGTYIDGTKKMRLTVNGVKLSVIAFSGSFGAQDLRFFYGNTVHAGWTRSLKYYEKPRW